MRLKKLCAVSLCCALSVETERDSICDERVVRDCFECIIYFFNSLFEKVIKLGFLVLMCCSSVRKGVFRVKNGFLCKSRKSDEER